MCFQRVLSRRVRIGTDRSEVKRGQAFGGPLRCAKGKIAMGSNTVLRLRRSAAQLHALAQVEREIRATDSKGRTRYLRDFADSYRTYETVLTSDALERSLLAAEVVLVGDYHALPASQRFLTHVIEDLAGKGRPVVVGLEAIFARHQYLLDDWMAGEISEEELRERTRFDVDWGYAWEPYSELLHTARRHAQRIYGLDCAPRTDLRRIASRDRHAAEKVLEMRREHPDAVVLVLFGESHLAPNHLPAILRKTAPSARMLTLLQNVDTLYWKAAGEDRDHVAAVRVTDDVFCVFNATPLDKYESYRLCIERWRGFSTTTPDFAPSVYNLIDALLRFLNIDKYAESNLFQARYLVDLLPEVCCRPSAEQLLRLLRRKGISETEAKRILERVQTRGACHVAPVNAIFATDFAVERIAGAVTRFVHRACQGTLLRRMDGELAPSVEDAFYAGVLDVAIAYFGSKILCPSRPPVRESDLYPLYAQPREEIEGKTIYSYREYMELIDFLVLHKDYEVNHRHYRDTPDLIQQAFHYTGDKAEFVTEWLGQMLGTQLYEAYLKGRVSKRFLRSMFFRPLQRLGAATAAYNAIIRKVTKTGRRG